MKLMSSMGLAGLYIAALGPCSAAAAQTGTVLYSFRGDRNGTEPYAPLISDQNGGFYGTTSGNGAKTKACGSAFQLSAPTSKKKSWLLNQLHVFIRGTSDGCSPFGGLVADPSGVLYGTTGSGGANSGGAVFELTPPPSGSTDWTETLIYSFTQIATPTSSLIRDSHGILYGTTNNGGPTSNGSVFSLAPPAKGQTNWTETTLYAFQGGADGRDSTAALVRDASGALYGTTFLGGGGTLCQGGQGCGTVFMLTPPAAGQTGWTETILHAFAGGSDGSNPYAGLTLDKNGTLYGTTIAGGDSNGDGVVFQLSPPAAGQSAWTESVIHTFQGHEGDGANPYGGLIVDAAGQMYGTVEAGGTGCCGKVFKLAPPAAGQTDWTETALYNFQGGSDGAYPYAGVVRDSSKDLFGTTAEGGTHKFGTVFEIKP